VTTSSEPQARNQDWQKRYFDSLDRLERERQQFHSMEAVLKRLIGRLGSAAQGQSKQLDEQLKTLQASLRRDSTIEDFERVTSALTDGIAKLDVPADSQTAAPIEARVQPITDVAVVVDSHLRATLSALLTELRNDQALTILADELDSKLSSARLQDQLQDLISSIAALVTQRIQNIERSKHDIEGLLKHLVSRLDDIGRLVSDHGHDHSESLLSHETLNAHLAGEMKAMGDSVESAVDLQQIRTQVRGRLDLIGRHLKEFRTRETARINEMRTRNEQMQTRVTQLEAEASKLQHQLSDEQRLSSIDGLTNIPNRLAYDKRIQEELNRWQRFKHPTCVAVWDIDRFKNINDKHGHRAGDRVLRAVADTLSSRLRRTDFLARIGGEEFITILCGTEINAATALVDGMRIAISEVKFHTSGTPLPPVTISIGLTALVPNDTAGTAFDRADKALYHAKNAGRNRCSCA